MALMATLTDAFATKDTAKWYWPSAATVTGGTANVPCTTSWDELMSQAAYDLTNSSLCAQVTAVPTGSGLAGMFAQVGQWDQSNSFGITVQSGVISFIEMVSGATNSTTLTYDSTAHKWWRIRHASSIVYWETSPDGITWTTRRSKSPGVAVTALYASFLTGADSTSGTFSVDNVNLPPAAPATANLTAFFQFLGLNASGDGVGTPAAPTLFLGWMDPVYYLTGSGTKTVTAAPNYVYSPSTITWSLVSPPSWASIDPSTGAISIDTSTGFDWTTLTVRASTSGGTCDITIEAWCFTPNKTIAAGAAWSTVTPAPGDIVLVRGGTYTATQDISAWDGTNTSTRTRVVAHPDETVTFDCSSRTGGDYILETNGMNNVELRGFKFVDDGHCYFAIWNGSALSSGNRIAQCEFSGFLMTSMSLGQGTRANSGVWAIEHNRIHDNVRQNVGEAMGSSGWARGLVMDYCDGSLVRCNRFYRNFGEGFGVVGGRDYTVEDNISYDNYSCNFYFDNCAGVNALFEVHRNIAWSNDPEFYRSDTAGPASSIAAANEDYNSTAGTSGGGKEQATTGLNVTGNMYLVGNVAPHYNAGYGDAGGAGTSVFTPNSTFTADQIRDVWR